jgi:hypothetical protein
MKEFFEFSSLKRNLLFIMPLAIFIPIFAIFTNGESLPVFSPIAFLLGIFAWFLNSRTEREYFKIGPFLLQILFYYTCFWLIEGLLRS